MTDGTLVEQTQLRHGGPSPTATSTNHKDVDAAHAGCSHWLDSGQCPIQSAAAISSSNTGASPSKRVCTAVGSENSWVIVSSSSLGHVDVECANLQKVEGNVCEEKDMANSGNLSYPDNELCNILSSSGSDCKDQPSLHGSGDTCMLQTASGIQGNAGLSSSVDTKHCITLTNASH